MSRTRLSEARTSSATAATTVLLLWPAAAPGATPVRKDFYGAGANTASSR
ncbi:MAG: hypothetical protein M3376_08220 [Actinomycetota bacterium]|nr:hypothetical protein [Actinomycetota bacterium]